MEQECDVLVIGGSTAGLFFAARMARQGYKTVVVEQDDEEHHGGRYDIFHLSRSTFRQFGLEEPKEGDDFYVGSFTQNRSRSALNNHPKKSDSQEILVLRRHPFMRHMEQWAAKQGAVVLHETLFQEPVFGDSGILEGARVGRKEKTWILKAKLTADAGGSAAPLRTSLAAGYGVETFSLGPRDQFYVVLYYADLENPQADKRIGTCGWPYYKTWIAPQLNPNGIILGVGENLSYEFAEERFADFARRIPLPPHRVTHVEKGTTPYRRPPVSFVADGFVALGDAACLTNPWNGEGVALAWRHAAMASEVAGTALKNGDVPSRESLWDLNFRYYTEIGAENERNRVLLAAVVDCSPNENDFEFEQDLFFVDENANPLDKFPGKILKGIITGRIKISTVVKLACAAARSTKTFNHYRNYPKNTDDFSKWKNKNDSLWSGTRLIADVAEKRARDKTLKIGRSAVSENK